MAALVSSRIDYVDPSSDLKLGGAARFSAQKWSDGPQLSLDPKGKLPLKNSIGDDFDKNEVQKDEDEKRNNWSVSASHKPELSKGNTKGNSSVEDSNLHDLKNQLELTAKKLTPTLTSTPRPAPVQTKSKRSRKEQTSELQEENQLNPKNGAKMTSKMVKDRSNSGSAEVKRRENSASFQTGRGPSTMLTKNFAAIRGPGQVHDLASHIGASEIFSNSVSNDQATRNQHLSQQSTTRVKFQQYSGAGPGSNNAPQEQASNEQSSAATPTSTSPY